MIALTTVWALDYVVDGGMLRRRGRAEIVGGVTID